MAETKPIPVRLPEGVIHRLDEAAAKIGNTRAGIIRYCVETWLKHFEEKGVAALPLDWEQITAEFDGRTNAAKKKSDPDLPSDRRRDPAQLSPEELLLNEEKEVYGPNSEKIRKLAAESLPHAIARVKKSAAPAPLSGVAQPTSYKRSPKPGSRQRRAAAKAATPKAGQS